MIFPMGEKNDTFAKYFLGQSYLNMISLEQVIVRNVIFELKCRNNWRIHRAEKGGGQMLLCAAKRGYYQEWGHEPRELNSGEVVHIPEGVKH